MIERTAPATLVDANTRKRKKTRKRSNRSKVVGSTTRVGWIRGGGIVRSAIGAEEEEVEKASPRKKQKLSSSAESGAETERTGVPRRGVVVWALEGRRVLDAIGINTVVGTVGPTAYYW